MNWPSWGDFWAMGGYAPFVWGSYGVTVLAIVVEIWLVRQRRFRALAGIGRQRGPRYGDETEA
jgi:heme exporter protein D